MFNVQNVKMEEELHQEPIKNDSLTDHSLMQLELPDNDQTWLFCSPGSDPNCVVDLTEFLRIDSEKSYDLTNKPTKDASTKSYAIDSKTFTRPKKQYSNVNKKKQILSNYASCRIAENAAVLNDLAQYVPVTHNPDGLACENFGMIEDNASDIVTKQGLAVTPKQNTYECINNSSYCFNVGDQILLDDISAPKGIDDTIILAELSNYSQLSNSKCIPFIPQSMSTPTKKLTYLDKKKSIDHSHELLKNSSINNSTFNLESVANNTYSILETNGENVGKALNTNFKVAQVISNSELDFSSTGNVTYEVDHQNALQNTFVFKDSLRENETGVNDSKTKLIIHGNPPSIQDAKHIQSNENYLHNTAKELDSKINKSNDIEQDIINKNIPYEIALGNAYLLKCALTENIGANITDLNKPLRTNYKSSLSSKDDTKSQSDDNLNYSFTTGLELNSKMTRSKDNDSEQDSCYSSSSNIRSIGDVCSMSQLLPQKKSNLESTLKKARSDDVLFTGENVDNKMKLLKLHGSAMSLVPQRISQFTGGIHLQKASQFSKSLKKPALHPTTNLLNSDAQHMGVSKPTTAIRQPSKIPQAKSRIPKLNVKKN